jgi:hypothetical protein
MALKLKAKIDEIRTKKSGMWVLRTIFILNLFLMILNVSAPLRGVETWF